MSKLLFYVCIALLVGTVISASTGQRPGSSAGPTCKSHGDPCNTQNECCANTRCNKYAHRCQVIITEADLTKKKPN
ncbi:omega-conotoxin-like protein 1 [Diprion similis]|uniref:omega-conotoxin-like protein 1 n=1 Tax=Diprion similis TaxID=362088 RepID=UPI001EF9796C|nr:omega-conotoxin-like protein 1 [Diprion similis]